MKEHVIRNLPDLLEELERTITANGGHVHWAKEGVDVQRLVVEIARKANVQKVVKAKSMATEEVHLNQALQSAGMKVVETDLGEYIIQLAGEPPSHIVAPVIHRRVEEIAEVFQRELDMPPTLDPAGDMQRGGGAAQGISQRRHGHQRLQLRHCRDGHLLHRHQRGQRAHELDAAARLRRGHGHRKARADGGGCLSAIPGALPQRNWPTVQRLPLHDQRPTPAGDTDGPEEFHVILLDNGRVDMLAREYGEALCCLRCGACLNVCPVYREIGGHAYGSTYSGPIGAVISPSIHLEVTDVDKLPYASSLCGACREACPAKIDLPRMLLELRRDVVEEGDAPLFDRQSMQAFSFAMGSRRRYEAAGKLGSLGSNVFAGMSGGNIKFMPARWPRGRAAATSRRWPRSFREQWKEHSNGRKIDWEGKKEE